MSDVQGDSQGVTSVDAEDILATVDGIPLPPAIKKNLWKSLGRLVTGLVDIPIAHLEAKAERVKGETAALNLFREKVAEKAATEFMDDEGLMNRAVDYYGSKLLREQLNREAVMRKTAQELSSEVPESDADNEIDEDWVEMFARIAESKSNEDVQLILSKILNGEIRKPGSFSPKTLQTLTLLDQNTAQIFQRFCAVSYEPLTQGLEHRLTQVICQPFDSPGNNGLSKFGLSYSELSQLQDAGLVQYDLTAWREINGVLFMIPFRIGSKEFKLVNASDEIKPNQVRTKVINFTRVGLELRKVQALSTNPQYNDELLQWVKGTFDLK